MSFFTRYQCLDIFFHNIAYNMCICSCMKPTIWGCPYWQLMALGLPKKLPEKTSWVVLCSEYYYWILHLLLLDLVRLVIL